MLELYQIEGTKNINEREVFGPEYCTETTWPTFQTDFIKFKEIIKNNIENKITTLFLRVFDGEFYFLMGQSIGNIPKRHCSRPLTPEFIKKFKDGVYKADYILMQLYQDQMDKYNQIFTRRFDYPMEFIYAIVANKWLFKNFKNIGIIGGQEKIKVIQELFKRDEYKQYIGLDGFTDYISVPERFTCDNTELISEQVGNQLKNSNSDLFIFGMGIGKMAVAHTFKQYKNAVYIDVGCGISALAGTVGIDRPYFGGWNNYRLKGYDYSRMDATDYYSSSNDIYI